MYCILSQFLWIRRITVQPNTAKEILSVLWILCQAASLLHINHRGLLSLYECHSKNPFFPSINRHSLIGCSEDCDVTTLPHLLTQSENTLQCRAFFQWHLCQSSDPLHFNMHQGSYSAQDPIDSEDHSSSGGYYL